MEQQKTLSDVQRDALKQQKPLEKVAEKQGVKL
jgi:hypothetical protein